MKTKEQIAKYNKEYFARPEVIARAKVRNAKYRKRRAEYKKTEAGKLAEKRYRQSDAAKERIKRNRLKTRYNLTLNEVEEMKAAQHNLCAICLKEPNNWHIDHDHLTNKVRGLLCGPCNMALGLFKDNIDNMQKAIEYLNGENIHTNNSIKKD